MGRFLAASVLILATLIPGTAQTAAVLPFLNRSPKSKSSPTAASNLDWIGESIAETLREALDSRGAFTLKRDEIQDAYRRVNLREGIAMTEASVMKIGETLDAEQVVYGSFEFVRSAAAPVAGGSLHVTARVVDRRRLRQSPEFVETAAIEDLATLEAHLAWRALNILAPQLAPLESDFRSLRAPIRLDAEENYVRGLLARTPEQKEKYFTQAARLDARFSHPCYELGRIHYERKEYRQAATWLEKVGSGDPHFREANFLLGLARFRAGDYQGAEAVFQSIAATVPLSEVYNNLGAAESRAHTPKAIDDFRRALDGDSNDADYHFNLGYALWKKGDFSGAAERFRAVLEREPDDEISAQLLARCLKKQGPRAGSSKSGVSDARLEGLERLKTEYQERAYWQLKSLLEPAPVKK